jgi:transposase
MPSAARPRRQSTDDWSQVQLFVASPEQATYEILRPIVLFGQPILDRARETGVPERTLRRKAARFDVAGMRSLFDRDPSPAADKRRRPPEVRRAMLELKAEHPAFGLREIARICQERFDRPVSHHAVGRVLTYETLPILPPRRFRRYHEIADPVERRRAVVTLYLDGWSVKAIAGYLGASRPTVYDVLRRWDEEGWPGLADRSRAPPPPSPQGRPAGDGRHPSPPGQSGVGRVPDPRRAAPAGDAPLPTDVRPHPGAASGPRRAATGGACSA